MKHAAVLPLVTALVAARPTYGYRRITAVLNRQLRADGLAPVNHKRVYRIMQAHSLLLARHYTERPDLAHDGKVVVMRSNLRRCSDGLEFTCWNGEVVRGAFLIDAHDREVIAWCAVANAGLSGSEVRDMMLEAVETRFGTYRVPQPVEMLSDNGSPYNRQGHPHLRPPARPQALLHAGEEPPEQRHLRGLRAHPEARLRPGHPAAQRRGRARIAPKLVRGLQHPPPALRAEDALASRVHRRSNRNRLSVRSNGGQITLKFFPGPHSYT